ncbi:hypothetical protein ILUMI_18041, partial [Ignelater luminosus]
CSVSTYIETAPKRWKRECMGMDIPINNDHLFTLSFTDDQAVLAQNSYDMEFMLRRLHLEYKKIGTGSQSREKNSNAKLDVLISDEAIEWFGDWDWEGSCVVSVLCIVIALYIVHS